MSNNNCFTSIEKSCIFLFSSISGCKNCSSIAKLSLNLKSNCLSRYSFALPVTSETKIQPTWFPTSSWNYTNARGCSFPEPSFSDIIGKCSVLNDISHCAFCITSRDLDDFFRCKLCSHQTKETPSLAWILFFASIRVFTCHIIHFLFFFLHFFLSTKNDNLTNRLYTHQCKSFHIIRYMKLIETGTSRPN